LECSDRSLYTGVTTDLERRVAQHNGLLQGGSRYTRSRRPVELVYFEEHSSRSSAQMRESAIKRMKTSAKRALCRSLSS
ncbi:MAG: GIY-YIG nuclease family protein, partial [Gammaproteobacteria bacterium]